MQRELDTRYVYPKHIIACFPFLKVAIMISSASLCYSQFCILSTLSSFSFILFYSRSSPCSSSHRAPVKPLTFPFFAYRKKEGTKISRRHERSKYFTVSCSDVWGPLPRFYEPFPRIFRRTDNKKYICETHLIFTLELTLRHWTFCFRTIVSVSCDRVDNSLISLNEIGIEVKIAIDTIWYVFYQRRRRFVELSSCL